jgi:hypothetical protein
MEKWKEMKGKGFKGKGPIPKGSKHRKPILQTLAFGEDRFSFAPTEKVRLTVMQAGQGSRKSKAGNISPA